MTIVLWCCPEDYGVAKWAPVKAVDETVRVRKTESCVKCNWLKYSSSNKGEITTKFPPEDAGCGQPIYLLEWRQCPNWLRLPRRLCCGPVSISPSMQNHFPAFPKRAG